MSAEKRLAAADAFWRDDQSEAELQQAEAIMAIARRLNFRPRSAQALPLEKRAKYLAQMTGVSDGIATRALIAYHFAAQRDLMSAFLDALGITHDRGLIKEEAVAAPSREKLAAAIGAVKASFPPEDVDLYVKTLAALDEETWGHAQAALEGLPASEGLP